MKYGNFSSDGREFIITTPVTPRPWANYLTNTRYCALISHTGGGYSFVTSSGYNRITRAYPGEMTMTDRPGRYVYVRDEATGEFFSINWQPVQHPYETWECRHGMGYTQISSKNAGIEGQIIFFVPLDDDVEIWLVSLKNTTSQPRRLSVFTYVEWCLGSYGFDLVETNFANLFKSVRFDKDIGAVIARMGLWDVGHRAAKPHLPWNRRAFIAMSLPVAGFDGLREEFTGRYRSLANPVVVERGQCANSDGLGRDAVGVLQGRVELLPGQECTFTVIMGAPEEEKDIAPVVKKFQDPSNAVEELDRLKSFWDNYLNRVVVSTPDPDFDLSVNIWNKYQSWVTFNWSRMSSYYIGGGSMFGLRDTSQDLLGVLPNDPSLAKAKLREVLRHQFRDGGTLHNWDPITDTGPRTGHSDDALWLVLATAEYLKETGDLNFLEELVPYYDGTEGTVFDHLRKSIEFTIFHTSPRGIPLMLAGDWNDGLDQVGEEGKGESVMTAEFLCWMLKEMIDICELRGDQGLMQDYKTQRDKLIAKINELCWDGAWYARGTTDEGELFGSSRNKYGRIYLNAQSWAVLSGAAPPERALECMEAARKHLDTRYGPAIFLPAYAEPDPHIGIITMFSPGVKENGTIFNHPVCWAIIAEAILGRGERAYDLFKRSSFITRGKDPDTYKVEPYIYCEYIYGPDSKFFGQGEFSWTTGTAAWMLKACLDWILGIRPEYRGLRVDPVIPPDWDRFTVRRPFRKATYDIEVVNPERVSRGVKQVTMDSKLLDSNLLPPLSDGKIHKVQVVMGK
ncbi:MAG TPA: glycosyl transferase family 36 [Firmicutes bacterium]|nr:glycosyl transferase family 36 [Bacillota bacterium]